MKVLMAAPYDSKGRYQGGIMYVANSIFNDFEQQKTQDIDIFKFETCRIERSNSSTSKFNLENLKNFKYIMKDLITEIKSTESSILYFHSSIKMALFKDIIAIRKAKIETKLKTILHIHFAEYKEIMFSNNILNKIIINMINKYVDKVVFLSKKTADEFIGKGLKREKVKVIYNFHTLNYTFEQVENKIAKTKEKDILDILFMGSIDERKGIFDVLQCVKEINGKFRLHICGWFSDDKTEKKFNFLIDELENNIIFHGYTTGNEKKEILYNTDLLILPSYSEGLPIVIMEAFGTACSVITTDVGAISEIFNENCGYIIKPGDINQLKRCIESLIDNRELCSQHMFHNYNYGTEFTIKVFINHIREVCNEVIEC